MRTFADHARAIAALHTLATEYPLLPAASVEIAKHAPDELLVSCWDLTSFEAWREALHVDDASIEYGVTPAEQVRLVAEAKFDGVTVLLHGYGPQMSPQALKAVAA